MPSYQHRKLVQRIAQLDTVPQAADDYAFWLKADGHLALLRDNADVDELIIYASDDHTFIHTVIVNQDGFSSAQQDDLLSWNGNPFHSFASYAWGGGGDDVWIERDNSPWGSNILQNARQLVYGRTFEGLNENSNLYYEIPQEYLHLTEIHWRPEQHAFCRFDAHGEFDNVVSITSRPQRGGVTLVSFKWRELEQYLVASGSLLVRMFDFTLFRFSEFTRWPDGPETVTRESDSLFYRQKVDAGKAAYTRGVQIIHPSTDRSKIFSAIMDYGWNASKDREYCEFLTWDWRTRRVMTVSTNPSATATYFDASTNSLPFETSPVFFSPEVLSKYKADRDKYTISEEHGFIHCRGAWELRTFDVNEAGQVHTYICYLRDLPDHEQKYWQSFNEEPKALIAQRAWLKDFLGEWTDIINPLAVVLSILRRWATSDLSWWKLREETLLEGVNTPRTTSRDEWAQAFSDLSKLVVEGFQTKNIRARLDEMSIQFDKDDGSLVLIERVLAAPDSLDGGVRLGGLRAVQSIRSNVTSHSRGSRAHDLEKEALEEHGTYQAHFEEICHAVVDELRIIEKAFS